MKVIIPVAGIGSRLRPLTHTAPKVLLHMAGKPILGHVLDGLKGLKIDGVIFVIGFMGEKIQIQIILHKAKRIKRSGLCSLFSHQIREKG